MEISELERAAAWGWRAPEEERLGEWLLRAAEGFTGRANSALAIGDPGGPLPEAVDAVCAWYAARGLPAMIAVPYPAGRPEDSELDRLLESRDWTVRSGAATVMTAEPGRVVTPEGVSGVEIMAEPGDDWLALYHYRGQELPPIARRLLLSAPWQAFGRVRLGERTVAIGRVAGNREWAGLTAIEVDPALRRRGLGAAVSAALAAAAAERGVRGVYLQVEDGNAAARALYHRVGFTDHHGYHYRVAPQR
jgi:GNAT superfamily N-acetyltransferase